MMENYYSISSLFSFCSPNGSLNRIGHLGYQFSDHYAFAPRFKQMVAYLHSGKTKSSIWFGDSNLYDWGHVLKQVFC